MNLRIFVVILSTILACTVFGENAYGNDSIVLEIEETLRTQCKHQVKALNVHMGHIARKEYPDSIKDYHIEACLDLFISCGENSIDDEGNIIIPAPRIEITDQYRGTKNAYFIRKYLERLKNVEFSKVIFNSSKCYIPNGGIKQVKENEYVATVIFYQIMIGYKGEIIVNPPGYSEYRATVHIKRRGEGHFDVLLGDITATIVS